MGESLSKITALSIIRHIAFINLGVLLAREFQFNQNTSAVEWFGTFMLIFGVRSLIYKETMSMIEEQRKILEQKENEEK